MGDEIGFGDWTPEMSRRGLSVPEISEVGPPPSEDLLDFGFIHPAFGKPVKAWVYRGLAGEPLGVVARYVGEGEKKTFLPWTWHLKENRWVSKGFGKPRPLYGLQKLVDSPSLSVMLCEGEGKSEAAQTIVGGRYVVLAWSGGAAGVKSADWSTIYGRKVLIWPDADDPGAKAAEDVVEALKPKCPEIKVINVSLDKTLESGWDAKDALEDGWTWDRLAKWATPLIVVSWPIQAPKEAPVEAAPTQAPQAPPRLEIPPTEVLQPDENSMDEPFNPSLFATWERLQLSCLKNGNPHINLDNVYRFLSNETAFKNYLWYDEFHEQIFTQFDPNTHRELPEPKLWGDADELVLLNYLQRHVGMTRMNLLTVSQGVSLYSQQHVRNEPREWLTGLNWDGGKRIDKLFVLGFGAMPNIYSQKLARNFMISLAARILRPGCQVDTMPVLCGIEGIKKSTTLSALAAPWFAELSQKIDSLEFFRALRGKLVVEIAELAAFKKSQIEEIKKMITTKQDHYRGLYGRHTEAHPRRTVFVGTTNAANFLDMSTGARRFPPLRCGLSNPKWIADNREQLFAEAAESFRIWERTRQDADGWWEMPHKETKDEQEKVRDFDEWENPIEGWLEDTMASDLERKEVTLTEVGKGALGLDAGKIGRMEQLKIAKCMRVLGWEDFGTTREGKRIRLWHKIGSVKVDGGEEA